MTRNNRAPLIVLGVLAAIVVGFFALSFLWTPAPKRSAETISLNASALGGTEKPSEAQVEYP